MKVTAERVRKIRKRLKLTQAQLAEKLGVARVTVARWECGVRACQGSYRRKLKKLGKVKK